MYAIGDLVHGPALAHKASDEGVIAVEDAAGLETHPIEYIDIPRATFCTPNVGSFGLTEAQARRAGLRRRRRQGPVRRGRRRHRVRRPHRGRQDRRRAASTASCSAATSSATRATELIQELVNVRVLEGGYPEVARTIHGHPTLSEAVMEAGRAADGWLIHG